MEERKIVLLGRIFVSFDIRTLSGLHVGGSDAGIEIGGIDKTVVRDVLTNKPYIPGSSLKGKMRSLQEKNDGLPQNKKIGKGYIHSCETMGTYKDCAVCQVYGVSGDQDFTSPTRLVVRDTQMKEESAQKLESSARTDLPYTEVKTEVAIDRVTSKANPRQMERVPADTVFSRGEMVYSIYDGTNCDAKKALEHFSIVVQGMKLLEEDYLGGLGSRGSGKVRFERIKVQLRMKKDLLAEPEELSDFDDLQKFTEGLESLKATLKERFSL